MEPLRIDGVSAIAVIVIASFGIDRIVTGLLFVLSFIKPLARVLPDPDTKRDALEHVTAKRRKKLVYFLLAAILSSFAVWRLELRIFEAIGFRPASTTAAQTQVEPQGGSDPSSGGGLRKFLDGLFTALILMGGADRVAALLKIPGGERSEPRPIEIKGSLVLEDDDRKKIVGDTS